MNFFWAYTDLEVGTPYTPSQNNSEGKRNFLKCHAICLSQPTWQHLSQGSVTIRVTSEESFYQWPSVVRRDAYVSWTYMQTVYAEVL